MKSFIKFIKNAIASAIEFSLMCIVPIALVGGLLYLVFSYTQRDADIASYNLSQEADSFKVNRRIVFYNGITGGYILKVEGFCSIEADIKDKQLEVTCKTADSNYKKHYLGLSDNVTYFAEQLNSNAVSKYHYSVVFKPQAILPDINLKADKKALGKALMSDTED